MEPADYQPQVFSEKNLRSMVYNLLSNALKYRHPDRAPRVRISCIWPQHSVLRVRDNGLGLYERQRSRLFGLFKRQHSHVEGLRPSLYMVKRIVENVGGTIVVDSQLSVGTTFIITFPV